MTLTSGSPATVHLTLATGRYDRTAALQDGRVRPEGVTLTCLPLNVENIFWRMFQHREFDVAEMSLGGYVVRRGRGVDDIVAIPVFLSRAFRHSGIFVNRDAGISRPEDLRGRRVGVPEYQMTAAVWARGILSDDYGVRPDEIQWFEGGLEEPGRRPFEPVHPAGVALEPAPDDRSLTAMLAAGELDALVTARTPSTFDPHGGPIVRLFPRPWEEERDYFRRTGIFPIMHTVGIRREHLDAYPWLAQTLFRAFVEAKRLAQADLVQTSALPLTLPFLLEHAYTTTELMGPDPWPYGFEANRATLETFVRYCREQDLIERDIPIDSLFPATTRDTPHV
jgi:4,5-dihydroxyphthalate decarboxylase